MEGDTRNNPECKHPGWAVGRERESLRISLHVPPTVTSAGNRQFNPTRTSQSQQSRLQFNVSRALHSHYQWLGTAVAGKLCNTTDVLGRTASPVPHWSARSIITLSLTNLRCSHTLAKGSSLLGYALQIPTHLRHGWVFRAWWATRPCIKAKLSPLQTFRVQVLRTQNLLGSVKLGTRPTLDCPSQETCEI